MHSGKPGRKGHLYEVGRGREEAQATPSSPAKPPPPPPAASRRQDTERDPQKPAAATGNYWLALFSPTTWQEFREAGGRVAGFRQRVHKAASRVKAGDTFLCYLSGVMRWVGALRVLGLSDNRDPIWDDGFPVRFDVEPLVILDAERGIPLEALEGKVDFFRVPEQRGKYKGFLRSSPNLFKQSADGDLIFRLLQRAKAKPVSHPLDLTKLRRRPMYSADRQSGRKKIPTVVSIPDGNAQILSGSAQANAAALRGEIQFHLLRLGQDLGLDLWIPLADRERAHQGHRLGDMPGLLPALPPAQSDALGKNFELMDVLWLRRDKVAAVFQIATGSIHDCLLRTSDMLALLPKVDIPIYFVAPAERRDALEDEIHRPTYSFRTPPLRDICGFLPFAVLMEKVEGIRSLGIANSLNPDFLRDVALFFSEDEAAP